MEKNKVFLTAPAVFTLTAALPVVAKGQKQEADNGKVIRFASCNLKAYGNSTRALAEEMAKFGYRLEYVFLADNTQLCAIGFELVDKIVGKY
jgi:ABC-type proline/glycine betaine transport system substrate-binding protein